MNCLGKILHIVCFYLVLDGKYSSIGATPIIGSEDGVQLAFIEELFFIVSISNSTTSNSGQEEFNHGCGGALITHRHVLTAAHCFKTLTEYSEVVVKIGSNNLRCARAHAIEWWKTYNEWANITDPPTDVFSYYDVAIVKLRDVASSDISLPTISYTSYEQLIGQTVITGGWGTIEGRIKPRHKRIAQFYVLSPDQCRYSMYIHYFCTSSYNARLTGGDSGGPLLLKDRKTIIGVNKSGREQKGNASLPRFLNAHALIKFAEQFIQEVIEM